jgi:DHA1 family inner membrane transport protein
MTDSAAVLNPARPPVTVAAQSPPPGTGGARAVAALLALATSTFLYVTAETLPIGLLHPIAAGLDASDSGVGQLVTLYGLVVVLASLPLTYLTRAVPRRPLLFVLLIAFAGSTALSAAAPSYAVLFGARVVTALSQALFWSIVVPAAVSLFPARVRGRVLAIVFGGSSLASVAGVSSGTWIGQQFGWRSAFLALSGLGLLTALAVVTFLPGTSPRDTAAERAAHPDARRYAMVLIATILTVTGTFTFFTYISPFLTDGLGLAPGLVGLILFLRGLAGLAGVAVAGPLIDRHPGAAIVWPVAIQAAALLALRITSIPPVAAVALVAVTGLAFTALTTALANRVLTVAPGRLDLASAGTSIAVNVGITAGALLGGILLTTSGAASTALAGGVLTLLGLAVAACEAHYCGVRGAEPSGAGEGRAGPGRLP